MIYNCNDAIDVIRKKGLTVFGACHEKQDGRIENADKCSCLCGEALFEWVRASRVDTTSHTFLLLKNSSQYSEC